MSAAVARALSDTTGASAGLLGAIVTAPREEGRTYARGVYSDGRDPARRRNVQLAVSLRSGNACARNPP